jgi:hypothetical protein
MDEVFLTRWAFRLTNRVRTNENPSRRRSSLLALLAGSVAKAAGLPEGRFSQV